MTFSGFFAPWPSWHAMESTASIHLAGLVHHSRISSRTEIRVLGKPYRQFVFPSTDISFVFLRTFPVLACKNGNFTHHVGSLAFSTPC